MNPGAACILAFLLSISSLCLGSGPTPAANLTVMGTVFCDACADNFFSKHSYFLEGARVRVACMFKVNSTWREQVSVTVDRTTDKFGVYRLDIPPVDGFECREGLQLESCCRASLLRSSTLQCDVPGLSSSTEHVAIRGAEGNQCLYNLNALNYRPFKKDTNVCGSGATAGDEHYLAGRLNYSSSLFLWPHFGLPWPFPPLSQTPTPPSLSFPFTSAPNTHISGDPSAPPPSFSLWDPRTWFSPRPPSTPGQP